MTNPVKAFVGRAGGALGRWAADGKWVEVPTSGGLRLIRRRPIVFADVDSLRRLIAECDGTHIWVRDENRMWSVTDPGVAETVASQSREDRVRLLIRGVVRDERQGLADEWRLELSTVGPLRRGPVVEAYGLSPQVVHHARRVAALVDGQGVERRHLRKKAPIFEPISVADAAQREHDLAMQKKAERSGAIWGGITGALATVVVQVIMSLAS
ncbi:MAG: hypothetical protein NVV70_06420 [Cellulomonas sp.]|nr:hypothetical protein [Cellulomonas sp.]MCR6647778.1 hypothetical protein [Cellulomonas sp.]